MFYHASPIKGLTSLVPQVSNHNSPLIYFSVKRENTLVYLCNAVERYCVENGYKHNGKWHKWGSYGFTSNGILRLEEYYPNATIDTYKGVSAYIYSASILPEAKKLNDIPFVFTTDKPVAVENCEYISDAYDSIMEAVRDGKIILEKYADMSREKLKWIEKTMVQEYNNPAATNEYKYFLAAKFPFVG